MQITLTRDIFIDGEYKASGTELTVSDAFGKELIWRNRAVRSGDDSYNDTTLVIKNSLQII